LADDSKQNRSSPLKSTLAPQKPINKANSPEFLNFIKFVFENYHKSSRLRYNLFF